MGKLLEVSILEVGDVSAKQMFLDDGTNLVEVSSHLSKEVLNYAAQMQLQYTGLMNIAVAQIMAAFNKEEMIHLAMEDEDTAVFVLGKHHNRDRDFVRSALEVELESNFFEFLKELLLFNSEIRVTESDLDIQNKLTQMINLVLNDGIVDHSVECIQVELDIQPALDYFSILKPIFFNHIVKEGWLHILNGVFTKRAIKEELNIKVTSINSVCV